MLIGNDNVAKVYGYSDVILKINNDFKIILKNIKYSYDIHINNISIGRLDDERY